MPDPPPDKRRPRPEPVQRVEQPGPPYAELHCKTNFSFLEGASHADELVRTAVELGYAALAITDRNTLAGVVRAHTALKDVTQELGLDHPPLHLIIGAEIVPQDGLPVVLLATDRTSYGRLCRLLTVGRRRAPKGECLLTCDDIAAHAAGLLALVQLPAEVRGGRISDPPALSHPARGNTEASHEANGSRDARLLRVRRFATLETYHDIFGDRCYALAELHYGPDDRRQLALFQEQAVAAGVPLVAAGDVHYHHPDRAVLHDVLTATRHHTTVAEAGPYRFPHAQYHLKSRETMARLFADAPEALARTLEVAARCHFSLDELRYEYPEELCPPGLTPTEHLSHLTWEGARRRYPAGVPDKVRRLIEHELALIAELRYEAYFLTVWDLVQFARSRGILCQGRGSAANSAVCYCLGVTSVDPEQLDVLFERFVSRERNEAPDIDIDFEHERREEVLQYLYEKYGRDRVGMTAVVITYRARSAIRDAGKALGLPAAAIDRLAKSIDGRALSLADDALAERCADAGLSPTDPNVARFCYVVRQLIGFPRHLSQHVGGMVMTQGPLCELVPIENAAMPGRTVVAWDKDDLDALGILKVDCLALGMLTAIRKCFDLVQRHTGRKLSLASIPPDDQAVYDMMCRADTIGVFQIESRAQMSMLPRLRPRCFYDLVIQVAIVRPGPIQGDMVHPYLRRRATGETVEYPNDEIRQVLEKTLGVPLFQEQAMRLAVVAAGFTPGEADQLRRAMGAWRRPGIIDRFRQKLLDGMQARGLSRQFAEQVFMQIRGFGEYGFPESHAASFALLVYVSAWLKHYYQAAFTAALLNSQPMGFYAPAQLIRDARAHGVEVLPPDVNFSGWDHRLEPRSGALAVRLGLRSISGLGPTHAARIEAHQAAGPFSSFAEFARRTSLPQVVLRRLSEADAFGSLALNRRTALWQALAEDHTERPLFATEDDEPLPELPPLNEESQVMADYRMLGFTLRQHPLTFLRDRLQELNVTPAKDLATWPHGRQVTVAGIVLLRQRPSTAKGITFFTLEDETGHVNLVVRQEIWERDRQAARHAVILCAQGHLERREGVIHVVVRKLQDFSHLLQELRSRSRDFQ